jgi:hypothetical protein
MRRPSNRRSMLARDGDQLQTELGETSAEPWYLRLSAKTLIFHKGSVLDWRHSREQLAKHEVLRSRGIKNFG